MRWLIGLIGALFMNAAMAGDFAITSKSFVDGGTVPVQYTCDGKDISPPLTLSNAPSRTQSFAIICSDPDAPSGTWYHWVIYNIPGNTKEIVENQMPPGSAAGKNSWERPRYNGPCPPKGNPHHYIFTVYALDAKLTLSNPDAQALENAMKNHILQTATITALYGR